MCGPVCEAVKKCVACTLLVGTSYQETWGGKLGLLSAVLRKEESKSGTMGGREQGPPSLGHGIYLF